MVRAPIVYQLLEHHLINGEQHQENGFFDPNPFDTINAKVVQWEHGYNQNPHYQKSCWFQFQQTPHIHALQ